MRISLFILSLALTTLFPLHAETAVGKKGSQPEVASEAPSAYTDSILAAYTQRLQALVAGQGQENAQGHKAPSPYLFRLFGTATLYSSALAQNMAGFDEEEKEDSNLPSLGQEGDRQLMLNEIINEQLNRAYVQRPDLFATTQSDLMSTTKLRSDLTQKVEEQKKIAEKVVQEVPDVQVEAVEPEVKKPNFWNFKGNGKLQFTQSYFSKNWYQGGENNYAMLGVVTLNANYNNQRKVQLAKSKSKELSSIASSKSFAKITPLQLSKLPRATTPSSAPPATCYV